MYVYICICTETHDTPVFIAPVFQLVIRKYILNAVQGVDTIIPAIEIFRTGISNSLHLVNITWLHTTRLSLHNYCYIHKHYRLVQKTSSSVFYKYGLHYQTFSLHFAVLLCVCVHAYMCVYVIMVLTHFASHDLVYLAPLTLVDVHYITNQLWICVQQTYRSKTIYT